MFKGMVLKVTEEYAVVLTEQRAYVRVRVKDGLAVGQKIVFFEEDLLPDLALPGQETDEKSLKKVLGPSILVASLVFFLLIGSGFLNWKGSQAYAMISVDINPSVELILDQQNVVIAISYRNQEARQVAGTYLKGWEAEEAVAEIVRKAAQLGYLEGQDTVLLATSLIRSPSTQSQEMEQGFADDLTKDLQATLPTEYRYILLSVDAENQQLAKEKGLSIGKYQLSTMGASEQVQTLSFPVDLEENGKEKEGNKQQEKGTEADQVQQEKNKRDKTEKEKGQPDQAQSEKAESDKAQPQKSEAKTPQQSGPLAGKGTNQGAGMPENNQDSSKRTPKENKGKSAN